MKPGHVIAAVLVTHDGERQHPMDVVTYRIDYDDQGQPTPESMQRLTERLTGIVTRKAAAGECAMPHTVPQTQPAGDRPTIAIGCPAQIGPWTAVGEAHGLRRNSIVWVTSIHDLARVAGLVPPFNVVMMRDCQDLAHWYEIITTVRSRAVRPHQPDQAVSWYLWTPTAGYAAADAH